MSDCYFLVQVEKVAMLGIHVGHVLEHVLCLVQDDRRQRVLSDVLCGGGLRVAEDKTFWVILHAQFRVGKGPYAKFDDVLSVGEGDGGAAVAVYPLDPYVPHLGVVIVHGLMAEHLSERGFLADLLVARDVLFGLGVSRPTLHFKGVVGEGLLCVWHAREREQVCLALRRRKVEVGVGIRELKG